MVTVELTSNVTCASATTVSSNGITMTVNLPLSPFVSISVSPVISPFATRCAGDTIIFTAQPAQGGTNPSYQWKVNGVNVGTNSPTFISNTLNNNDSVLVEMTSSQSCVTGSTASAVVQVPIAPLVTPQVAVVASNTSICSGETVTFSASSTFGGNNRIFEWFVNSVSTGVIGSSRFYTSNSLNNGDIVSVELTSSITCVTQRTVASSGITMTVNPIPAVSINNNVNGVLCNDDTLQLSGSPAGGSFSGGAGVSGTLVYRRFRGIGVALDYVFLYLRWWLHWQRQYPGAG